MLYYDDILFSLYEIKEDAKILNNNRKNVNADEIQDFTSRIIEHAKAAINEVKTQITIEDLRAKKAFEEINRRENTGDKEEET